MSSHCSENRKKLKIAYNEFIKHYPLQTESLKGEIWRPIKDYEFLYLQSNFGRTKSLHFGKERILRPLIRSAGFLSVGLWKDCNPKLYHVEALTAETFLPKPPGYFELQKKDGDPFNNHVDNLEWVPFDPELDFNSRKLQRLQQQDEFNILKQYVKPADSDDIAIPQPTRALIRLLRSQNPKFYSYRLLAKLFGYSRQGIWNIVNKG